MTIWWLEDLQAREILAVELRSHRTGWVDGPRAAVGVRSQETPPVGPP